MLFDRIRISSNKNIWKNNINFKNMLSNGSQRLNNLVFKGSVMNKIKVKLKFNILHTENLNQ